MYVIDKDTLAKEILKQRDEAYPQSDWNRGYVTACEKILSLLDTLETKEVDLETELSNYIKKYRKMGTGCTMFGIARHFFNLGLNAKKGE